MSDGPSLFDHLYNECHPLRSPILGRFLSATVCALGHEVVVMKLDTWDEPWLACSVCGARFAPESIMADDYDVVKI
ncbi:hypothetical protein HWV23_02800 [Natronomonas halophila]|uniref:hypothetical protein n=1 Tax=Natronomonas halophila TaxID=2747817 RepID=UPI0015B38AFD|nr:hypothetical protein [Natronomonas halophila]QLD84631.1 hypothetical protein HWV23_02525 [Natronomonas halophila]QLD84685.1 hypothetical protein HWV23_02800 [Natronomonas halophila]